MMDKIVTYLANQFLGKVITKGVTYLAAILVTKGFLDASHQAGWVADTVQIGSGLALTAISFVMSKVAHAKQQSLANTAVNTPAAAIPLSAPNRGVFPNGVIQLNNAEQEKKI